MLNLHVSEKVHFMHFPGDVQKNCSFENFKENSRKASFLEFLLGNLKFQIYPP